MSPASPAAAPTASARKAVTTAGTTGTALGLRRSSWQLHLPIPMQRLFATIATFMDGPLMLCIIVLATLMAIFLEDIKGHSTTAETEAERASKRERRRAGARCSCRCTHIALRSVHACPLCVSVTAVARFPPSDDYTFICISQHTTHHAEERVVVRRSSATEGSARPARSGLRHASRASLTSLSSLLCCFASQPSFCGPCSCWSFS